MIEFPKAHYDQLRLGADQVSPTYFLLINGCIETRQISGKETQIVQILCTPHQAEAILELARRIHPGAAHAIEAALTPTELSTTRLVQTA